MIHSESTSRNSYRFITLADDWCNDHLKNTASVFLREKVTHIFKKLFIITYKNVRYSQRCYEKICRLANLTLHNKADQDEEVAECSDDDADRQADRDDNGEHRAERSRPTFWTTRCRNSRCGWKKKFVFFFSDSIINPIF